MVVSGGLLAPAAAARPGLWPQPDGSRGVAAPAPEREVSPEEGEGGGGAGSPPPTPNRRSRRIPLASTPAFARPGFSGIGGTFGSPTSSHISRLDRSRC